MAHPHVSIIVPVYNEQNYIGACLTALERQTIAPDVVYVVDNNCTDDTLRIAQTYPFVEIIHESTQGICASTKRGLDTAMIHDGIMLRCDADCMPADDWVEKVVAHFAASDPTMSLTGPGVPYDCSRFVRAIWKWLYMKPYFVFVGAALGHAPLFGSNFTLHASTWRTIKNTTHLASHQNIHDDIDLSFHLPETTRVIYDDTLSMPISARPFSSPSGMIRRFSRGFRSIFVHWPEHAPWRRYTDVNNRD